jgi:hypothetical protein
VRQRSAGTVSVDLDRDHVRVALRQVGRPDPQPGSRSRGEVGDQDVGTVEKLMQNIKACFGFQVERHRLLAAVGPHEVRGKPVDDVVVVPGEVSPFGIFHLDDAGTEVGKHPRAHRSGDRLLQGHHGDSRQRPPGCRHHITMPPSTGNT